MPHLTVVAFQYNAELDTIDIGGRRGGFSASKKYRDALATGKAAFVVDDIRPDAPGGWGPRGIETRGRVVAHATGGDQLIAGGDPAFLRVFPTRIVSWGVNSDGYRPDGRDVAPA